jgi:hypothetical protein
MNRPKSKKPAKNTSDFYYLTLFHPVFLAGIGQKVKKRPKTYRIFTKKIKKSYVFTSIFTLWIVWGTV